MVRGHLDPTTDLSHGLRQPLVAGRPADPGRGRTPPADAITWRGRKGTPLADPMFGPAAHVGDERPS
ncbi:hypothetical protein BN13_170034 [Nostocoides jenkinsii Ben 74]|uniref:Uncharacterized protein n=1 Tax=Nostocoides jenkinsii Ben 74 TaxID=1193518 RepID=A0A077MCM0_9MICO|nr:hypothetical protein BN13_170034 [Tetrasphaera jenkinsii Ben 74]